jgi:hypothetical protein
VWVRPLILLLATAGSLGCEPRASEAAWPLFENTHHAPWPGAKQQPLGEAMDDFANYINRVHVHIHPWFVDGFLTRLDALPKGEPRNRADLHTRLALVIDGRSGALVSVTRTGSSGVLAFDQGTIEAVVHAFPSAPPPPACWSSDGRVYLSWVFHRGNEACGTWNARPFKLAF